jgi:glutaredoxin 3
MARTKKSASSKAIGSKISSKKSTKKTSKKSSKKSSSSRKDKSDVVKVYSTPGCLWCLKVKDYLTEKKIKFEDIDVSADDEALDYIVAKSGEYGIPQIEINGKVLIGFDKASIDAEIKKLRG